jgi:hypothetical protein
MRLVQAAAAVALVAGLGGCFLLPVADAGEEQEKTETSTQAVERAPEAGDCWTGEYTSYMTWASWKGDDAVDCGESHQSYTYAISNALAGFDESYPLNGMNAEASTLAYESCNSLLAKFLHHNLPDWPRVETYWFGPSMQQWHNGERWVRCDLVIMELGSSIFESTMVELPENASELVDALADNVDYFDVCVDTDDGWSGWGPYESESAVYSDCSVDPMWRLHGFELYPADWEAPYPGREALEQFVSEGCLADVAPDKPGFTYYPDESMWDEGDRSVTCWTYEWEAPEVTAPPV